MSSRTGAVVIGSHWHDRRAELAYATRSIAGAATRGRPVSVLVPGTAGEREPDGAFDLEAIGESSLRWPDGLSPRCAVVVDDVTTEVAALLGQAGPVAVWFLSLTHGGVDPAWRQVLLAGDPSCTGVYVPVHPMARTQRHHGFGFTDYLLVLSDRSGPWEEPPGPAAWLGAAFGDADVVVIQDAVASAWRGGTLRGSTTVDTRMDLWRLVAHANVCIDLGPGSHIARECIEALRLGTPIVVPEGSAVGTAHARASGGGVFSDEEGLLRAVADFRDGTHRAASSARGKDYADALYGDPEALVERVDELLSGPGPSKSAEVGVH